MTVAGSLKFAFALGFIAAGVMSDVRAAIFTVPIAVVVVSSCCLVHSIFFESKR